MDPVNIHCWDAFHDSASLSIEKSDVSNNIFFHFKYYSLKGRKIKNDKCLTSELLSDLMMLRSELKISTCFHWEHIKGFSEWENWDFLLLRPMVKYVFLVMEKRGGVESPPWDGRLVFSITNNNSSSFSAAITQPYRSHFF